MLIYEYLHMYTMVCDGILWYANVYDGMLWYTCVYFGIQSTVVFLQRDILATWHFYNESVKLKYTIAESIVIG